MNKPYTWEELYQLAFRDKLTGVYTRTMFECHKEEYNREKLWVTIVRVDNLREINNFYGKTFGDQILQEVVTFLNTRIVNKIIFRMKGNEFIVLSVNQLTYEVPHSRYASVHKYDTMNIETAMRSIDKKLRR